jgi:putative hydrolase of the HAD superfamily
MGKSTSVTTLFLDIGGVMLTNGWEQQSRKLASEVFNFSFSEMEERHNLVFVVYEEGKLTLDEYLQRVLFYQKRVFTPEQFKEFMFAQSSSYMEMIGLIQKLKEQYNLKIAVVSNEAKELNEFRIKKFQLNAFVDFFISSCYVHCRKPDAGIFRLALDIAQVQPQEVVYIDDVQMFVDVAREHGIQSIQHNNYLSTSEALADIGLCVK